MKKIALIIGARPNFMKAFPVYESLKEDFDLTLIHTGQHFDAKMSDVFFNQLKFPKPDIHLTLEKKTKAGNFDDKLYVNNEDYLKDKDVVIQELMTYDGDLGQLGEIRDKLIAEFQKVSPELVVVFGDVTSTLAAGLSAKILNIDLAHVESGLRSGDMKMPEEVNRILTDHITKYYFVTEQSGVDNLKNTGITENVYLVGNTMIDTQKKYLQQALDTKYNETLNVKSKEYVLITLHRPSNVDNLDKLKEIFDDFEELSKTETLVYPIHPRTKNNLEKLGYLKKVQKNPNIILDEPLGYLEFTCLLNNCKYTITDSGGLQEESTALNIPCFTLRENTERPSTLIENNGTNQLIHKISEIKLKKCKGTMKLWDGKSSEKILLKILNAKKKALILRLYTKRIHPLHFNLGNKITTYEYCIKQNILVPNLIYKGNYDNLDYSILKGKGFVIKLHCEDSCRGIFVIAYKNDMYYNLFDNKSYTFSELYKTFNDFYKNKLIFIEERLGKDNSIPVDLKLVYYNGKLKELNIHKREAYKKVLWYCFSYIQNKAITSDYFTDMSFKYFLKKANITDSIEDFGYDISLTNKLKEVGDNIIEKIDFKNGIIRLDLYLDNNKFYLGEFTLSPGYHMCEINVKYLRDLLSECN
jgi:UDP-N-acetylglucosamine 2-epimerase (non-hydrolysing)